MLHVRSSWSRGRALVAWLAVVSLVATGLVLRLSAAEGAAAAAPATSESYEREDVVSAELLARSSDRRVEVTGYRTEATTTFVNPDGTFTSEIAAGPIRVWHDADSRRGISAGWRDIDPSLERDGSWLRPRATKGQIRFSYGGASEAARLSHEGRHVGMAFGSLPVPTVSGSVATYSNVQPGVDLQFEARSSGFSQRLVLRERPQTSPVWRFPLSLAGQSISQDGDGNIALRDVAGKQVGGSEPAGMWGSRIDAASGDPARRARVTTRIVGQPGSQVLEIAPDFSFLSDPSVELPIVVDPSPTLFAAADTFVQSDWLVSQWTATELRAGSWNGGTSKRGRC